VAAPLLHPGDTVRRSERARRVRVCVEPDGALTVTLPRRAPVRAAEDAVLELAPWIERRRRALEAARADQERPAGTVPYLGATLALAPEPGRTRVHRVGDTLRIPAAAAQQGPALERWYRRRARAEIEPRLTAACAQAGLGRHTALTIRNQRTRWASCSPDGAMSFNWRLLLAPADVLDYVVWHEVCHLAVADHSPRFWALLAGHRPGYREPQSWLRRYGATLTV